MTKECLLILQEMASELKNDAKSLKCLSKIAGFKGSISELSPSDIFPTDKTEILQLFTQSVDNNRPFKDMRLKELTFKFFRTFPDAGSKPFGITFEKTGCPCSTFLIGRNGTGKSTLFDAIEYYYSCKVSNADQKAVDIIQSYLTFGFKKIEGIDTSGVLLGGKTQVGDQELNLNGHSPICLPAPFCSELDIITISTLKDGNLYDYIFKQLGYSDLLKLQENIKKIIDLGKKNVVTTETLDRKDVIIVIETYMKYRDAQKETILTECEYYANADTQKVIEQLMAIESLQKEDKTEPILFDMYWKGLKENVIIERTTTTRNNIDLMQMFRKLQMMYDLLKDALKTQTAIEAFYLFENQLNESKRLEAELVATKERREEIMRVYDIVAKIEPFLDIAIDKIVDNFVAEYKGFLEGCLSYFSESNESFTLNYNKINHKVSVVIKVEKEEGSFLANPNEYLNSFRFKLYAIALKLSLAFCYMNKNRLIVPIAIDDVFNANDFDNSGRLQQFVRRIYQLYYEKVCKTIPLQIIVLTHDEMILNAFYKGFNSYQLYKDNCIIGRIFPYWLARKMYNKLHKGYLYSEILNIYTPLN